MRRPIILVIGLALWLTAVVGGTSLLWRYSLAAGNPGTPGAVWPAASQIVPEPGRATLVMTIHPHCPCSRASIGELSILMAQSQGKLDAFVVFVEPPGLPDSWTKTDLWSSAGLIPGVTRVIDVNREARLFGAATSGQTMVYDGRGRLIFSGGMTGARGHFGDNAGLSAIVALLDQPATSAGAARTAVYGCPLFTPGSIRAAGQSKCPR